MAGSTGSATITETVYTSIKLVKFDWVTGSSSQTDDCTDYTVNKDYDGEVLGFIAIPDSTAIPSANYDIAIEDKNSIDILSGEGANLTTDATDYILPKSSSYQLGAVAGSSLTLKVTSAGTEKKGVCYLYIR